MSKHLKRVPLDFNWPINKTWKGYKNPYLAEQKTCPECEGYGVNKPTLLLHKLWFPHSCFDSLSLLKEVKHEELKKFARSILQKRHLGRMFFNWLNNESNWMVRCNLSLGKRKEISKSLEPLRSKIFDTELDLLEAMLDYISKAELEEIKDYINQCTSIGWSHFLNDEEIYNLVKKGRLTDLFDKWYSFSEEENSWQYLDRSSENRDDWKWVNCEQPVIPGAEMVNEWADTSMLGHDGLNQTYCVRHRATKYGIHGNCEKCNGEGEVWNDEQIRRLAETWKKEEPPKGEGYQLWEDFEPLSPVFETFEELCEYAESNCSTFAANKASAEEWKQMLLEDMVHVNIETNNGGAIFL